MLESRIQIESSHVTLPGGNSVPAVLQLFLSSGFFLRLAQHCYLSMWDLRSQNPSFQFPDYVDSKVTSNQCWELRSCFAASLMQQKDATGLLGPAPSIYLPSWPLHLSHVPKPNYKDTQNQKSYLYHIQVLSFQSVLGPYLYLSSLYFQCHRAQLCAASLLGLPFSWTAEKGTLWCCVVCWPLQVCPEQEA